MKRTSKYTIALNFLGSLSLVLCCFSPLFSQQAAPKTAEEFNIYGIVDLSAGKTDEAIRKFTHAIEVNPNLIDAYANRCSAYLQKQDHKAALADCDKAVKLNPKMWTSYYVRGKVFFAKFDFVNALQDFSTIISLEDDISMAYYYRAMLFSNLKEYEKAILDLTKIIELDFPNLPPMELSRDNVFFVRGRNYFELKKDDLGFRDLAQAIKMNPSSAQVYAFRGDIYFYRKQYDLAIKDFSTAIKLLPRFNPSFYRRRGLAYAIKSEWNLALADFTQAIQLSSKNSVYYKERAVVYRALGKTALAAKDEQTALKLGGQ